MSKPRWHPLPIDSQVVAAIEDRKEKFLEAYKASTDVGREEQWIFNHICTVFDHAAKLFKISEKELCDPSYDGKGLYEDENNT